jgi:hypothetical protein
MKRVAFGAISTLIGIVVALASFEVFAIAWQTLQDGRYTPATELFDKLQNTYVRDATNATGCTYVDTLFPHPYLGFVQHDTPPCGVGKVNNVGLTAEEFPDVKRTDRYVILLTGGSVAGQLGQIDPPPAPRYLEDELNAHYISPTGKPFQVLNGGAGAWKQPQQTILFLLYSNIVDAVVTLDGYNESKYLTLPTRGRLEMPGLNFLEVNPIAAQDTFGNVVVSWLAGRVAGAIGHHSLLSHSHAAFLAVRAVQHLSKGDAAFRDEKTTNFDRMFELPQEARSSLQALMAYQLSQYRRYIRIMDAIARDQGVKAMFFLQPVPAVGKTLTTEEKRANPDISYGERYVTMVRDLEGLREHGIAVVDLLDIFAKEKGTIYADDVHPYRAPDGESRGYRLIAARMAREMADAWGFVAKPSTHKTAKP